MATEQEKKGWEQMSNAEKKESFDKYMKYKLFEAHKTAKADWQRDMSKEEVDNTMPYNALTGKTYSRETSMLLRAEMAIKGYDKAQFVTMEQGNAMGGVLKLKHDEQTGEILKTKNGLQARVDGVKMLYIADHELRPKLDKDGKEVVATVNIKEGAEEFIIEMQSPYFQEEITTETIMKDGKKIEIKKIKTSEPLDNNKALISIKTYKKNITRV